MSKERRYDGAIELEAACAGGCGCTISGYPEDGRHQPQLLSDDGVSARTDGDPIDIAAVPGGRFLYG